MRRKRFASSENAPGGAPVVTMSDVAMHAGVSAQTVSRVVGRPELVAEATRIKVQEAIRALNYIPNEAARNLASKSSRVVAVIIPTLSSSVFAAQVKGIIDLLEPRGISVVIGNSEYSMLREEQIIQTLLERRPLGFILTGLQHSPRATDLLRQSGIPVVETWDTDSRPLDLAAGFSNIAAGHEVGSLLVARGSRNVAFVGGSAKQDARANGRFVGMAQALAEAGLPPAFRVELLLPMSSQDGIRGLDEVLQRAPMTDAIFFSADMLALAALLECNRRGVRVPEQLAICGFGDYDLAALVTPALTTVKIQPDEMGMKAAELLLARLDGAPDRQKSVVLRPQLIRRGSA
ncbi:LacI family DNA-binding transcriptional regulator [Labrys monachus]|uniref:LacI family gluconate utilization system Gnt-I transcriptional repressor n=1 Tax=Labrys monachus TaxID=217067 RepID=A0ABU0FEP5_9HYPH|nr:LacI family DNA-binding transcriptional regulator [Labrys monachus]MDQ0393084.1 LacI family gluconate utilization system Gnt-I transcriptional repressor [Labrys monachus]